MIIDTHAHIYSTDDAAYPPIAKPYRPPPGTGSPEHLRREMRSAGVDRAMLIQTFTYYGFDNGFVRDTAESAEDWAGGVVNLDPQHPHSADVLYALVKRSNVRAIRIAATPYGTYDLPGIKRLYAEADALGIAVNALLSVELADQLAKLVANFPHLPVVLDHCFTLVAGDQLEPMVRKVIELARYANLHAKLTFVAFGSKDDYPFGDMHHACKRIVNAFGSERCMWGSDFPTELWCPKTSYSDHLRIFRDVLGFTAREQEHLLGAAAESIYFGSQ